MKHSSRKETNFSVPAFLDRLRRRDHEAITMLIHAYTEQLLRASLGLGFDQNTSKELVQSVWVTFFEVVSNFQGKSHIRTFIFGILYNKASELRRNQRRFDSDELTEDILDSRFDANGQWIKLPTSPEDFLLGAENLNEIEKCLNALPLNQRTAFVLKEIEELESSEICKILGATITNLGVLLYRARKRLRDCIEGKLFQREDQR